MSVVSSLNEGNADLISAERFLGLTELNVYSPIKQTRDTEIIQQMPGRLPKPIYAGHPWL